MEEPRSAARCDGNRDRPCNPAYPLRASRHRRSGPCSNVVGSERDDAMTTLAARAQINRWELPLVVTAAAVAVILGAATVAVGPLLLAALIVLAFFALVAIRPIVGAYAYLVT